MNCFYHPDRDAVNTCSRCGQPVCGECNYVTGTHPICLNCWDKRVSSHKAGSGSEPVASGNLQKSNLPEKGAETRKQGELPTKQAVAAETQLRVPNMATVATASHAQIGAMSVQNTSGEGKGTIVPPEIKGWNWGAFLLSWIWGIGNSVWIALIVFIPIPLLALIMSFVLGAKGNQWAWQNKRWGSIEHFKRTQRTWRNWGIGVLVAFIILYAMLLILGIWTAGDLGDYV